MLCKEARARGGGLKKSRPTECLLGTKAGKSLGL